VLAVLTAAPVLVTGDASGSTVTAGTLTVSRTSGIPGEALTVQVSGLPGPAARKARLERCVGYSDPGTWSSCNYWVTVGSAVTTVDHGYTFRTRVHAMARNRYRVVAPGSSTLDTVVTPNKPVDGLQQDVSISLPTTAAVGSRVTVTVGPGIGPAREGRQVTLQRRNADGSYTQVAGPVAVDAAGAASIPLLLDTPGRWTYRTVALTWTPAGVDTSVGWFPSFPATVVVS
jgi:hypothetical protein